jgi:hypothetical protein
MNSAHLEDRCTLRKLRAANEPPIPSPTDTQLDPFYGQELRRVRRIVVKGLLFEWAFLTMCLYYMLFLAQQNPSSALAFVLHLFKA